MAVSVELPDLGRDMAGGLVAEWYLPDGAAVGAGEPVCRVECAFVAYEVEAAESGLLRIRRPAGSIERVGEVLGVILEPGEALPHEEPSSRHVPVAEAPLVPEVPEPEPEAALLEPGVPELEPELELELELEPETPEAVVVPFPRRFAAVAAVEWEMAPGDAVEFHTSFFSGAVDEVTHALPEAGGSIPGLPLWEPEEGHQASPAAPDGARQRFQRISDEASASAQVLTMSIDIDLSEAAKLVSVCQREWQKHGVVPRVEDAAFRAICLAIETTDLAGGAGGIVIAESSTDVSCAVGNLANKTLREAATSRAAGATHLSNSRPGCWCRSSGWASPRQRRVSMGAGRQRSHWPRRAATDAPPLRWPMTAAAGAKVRRADCSVESGNSWNHPVRC
ncbi:MAG: hypothetical protein IPF51_13780 [Dehalococcoidia bacterium]|uniref:biotin/lipoyl-containing protein n=1 Tax=Candidatus Amarobacter glycogenicus TaxID=3140699 RepID=UPI003134A50E|nr:hypothetical protein [Dehalococcoidia bacterium]